MKLLRGRTSSLRRYRVLGDAPDLGSRDLADALDRNAFQPIGESTEEDRAMGWVGPDHMFDTDLHPVRLNRGPYLLLTLRIDKLKVPRKLLRAHQQMEEVAWRKAHDRKKIPADARREIKEDVKRRLLKKVLPKTMTYDSFWHLRRGHVYLASRAKRAQEAFRALFRETFELDLEPLDPFHAAARLLSDDSEKFDELTLVEPTSFAWGDLSEPAPAPEPEEPVGAPAS